MSCKTSHLFSLLPACSFLLDVFHKLWVLFPSNFKVSTFLGNLFYPFFTWPYHFVSPASTHLCYPKRPQAAIWTVVICWFSLGLSIVYCRIQQNKSFFVTYLLVLTSLVNWSHPSTLHTTTEKPLFNIRMFQYVIFFYPCDCLVSWRPRM